MDKRIRFINILDLSDEYEQQLLEWRNQDFVREKMFNNQRISSNDHKQYLTGLKEQNNRKVFVCFLDGESFGVMQYIVINNNVVELSYYLIDSKWIDSGLGAIMEYAFLNKAFDDMDIGKVICRTLAFNTKVIKLHSKFGFESEYQKISNNGEIKDICYQQIEKDTWYKKRGQIKKLINYIMPIEQIEEIRGARV